MTFRSALAGIALSVLVPFAAEAMTVKTVASPQGVDTWLSEEHALPMIAVSVSIPAGSAYDTSNKPGLASLMASLMDEGAGDLDSNAFKQALESKAIKLTAQADRDYMVVQNVTLVFACATVLLNFIADILTVAVDPRVKM